MEASQELLEGTVHPASVIAVGEDQVTIKTEAGAEGHIPVAEFLKRGQITPEVAVGDTFPVYLDALHGGVYSASKDKAQRLALLDQVEAAYREGRPVEGEVAGEIEGGFSVDIGLRAFLPGSQVALRPVRDPEQVLGQHFKFKILRFERERLNIVLSRRALLEADRDKALERVRVGGLLEGAVVRLTDFGAFVDVGGLEGLVHISDLSWGRVRHPSEVLKLDDVKTFKVLKFDRQTLKLSLGLRQTTDDPWVGAEARYPKGTRVTGMVVSKTDYGCFIQIVPGFEGLIHSTGAPDRARDRLRKADIGEDLTGVVEDIDLTARRLSLTLAEG